MGAYTGSCCFLLYGGVVGGPLVLLGRPDLVDELTHWVTGQRVLQGKRHGERVRESISTA